ncbi:hypothetical protein BC834DRAFT_845060 [Gloeopeniophorella convolvens]|nr:hypothetical protein BC834DRAFT_845060 [Gloeopeniophorella convolvens]
MPGTPLNPAWAHVNDQTATVWHQPQPSPHSSGNALRLGTLPVTQEYPPIGFTDEIAPGPFPGFLSELFDTGEPGAEGSGSLFSSPGNFSAASLNSWGLPPQIPSQEPTSGTFAQVSADHFQAFFPSSNAGGGESFGRPEQAPSHGSIASSSPLAEPSPFAKESHEDRALIARERRNTENSAIDVLRSDFNLVGTRSDVLNSVRRYCHEQAANIERLQGVELKYRELRQRLAALLASSL